MNYKIIEKSLVPLFLATIFIVAYHWKFTSIYTFLIEHFKEDKLSTLYAHLFVYTFLALTIFIFIMNFINNLILKSKVFLVTSILSIFMFYLFSYEIFLSSISYFIAYPLATNEMMLLILFIVSSIAYGLYSLGILIFNKFIPFTHSLVFLLISLSYSAWFINLYAYPISEVLEKF